MVTCVIGTLTSNLSCFKVTDNLHDKFLFGLLIFVFWGRILIFSMLVDRLKLTPWLVWVEHQGQICAFTWKISVGSFLICLLRLGLILAFGLISFHEWLYHDWQPLTMCSNYKIKEYLNTLYVSNLFLKLFCLLR